MQNITLPGCKGLAWRPMNLLHCLVQGVRTSTWWYLFCAAVHMGTAMLVLEVSMTEEVFPWGGVFPAGGVVTGVCRIIAMLTGVSGSGVMGIVGCDDVPCIPWLFLEDLPDPAVRFMSVINLLLSLHDAMLIADEKLWEHVFKYYDCNTVENREKTEQYLKFIQFKACTVLSD